jgi:SEL1 protein
MECDDQALNGLGVLHLLGIEGRLEVDVTMAEKYFTLAKEMGNTDALYNLAMMWLGWKTHFKKVQDLQEDGVSIQDHVLPGMKSKTPATYALHVSQFQDLGRDTYYKGPLQSDMADATKLLTLAANKGHIQAKHRLAMMFSQGIAIQTAALKYDAVKKDCSKAKGLYQWIVENGSPTRSKRLRKAYQDYIAGDWEASLRNYLAAAETGSSVGQVNAAFLLERGTCLGLTAADCAKASVRLWKAAAARGHAEACLRVGDFYYYGRLRGKTLPVGPFGWVQYLLYPEEYMPALFQKRGHELLVFEKASHQLLLLLESYIGVSLVADSEADSEEKEDHTVKDEEDEDPDHEEELVKADLAMAAHYYQVAVEKHHSPRANFNLGFMHEWGLGLKQDFPLAKRHYDLAINGHSSEAELAVQISLMAMSIHEYFVKLQVAWEDWWNGTKKKSKDTTTMTDDLDDDEEIPAPRRAADQRVGEPTPGRPRSNNKTGMAVILSHLSDGSSLIIVILLAVVLVLNQMRPRR